MCELFLLPHLGREGEDWHLVGGDQGCCSMAGHPTTENDAAPEGSGAKGENS